MLEVFLPNMSGVMCAMFKQPGGALGTALGNSNAESVLGGEPACCSAGQGGGKTGGGRGGG